MTATAALAGTSAVDGQRIARPARRQVAAERPTKKPTASRN